MDIKNNGAMTAIMGPLLFRLPKDVADVVHQIGGEEEARRLDDKGRKHQGKQDGYAHHDQYLESLHLAHIAGRHTREVIQLVLALARAVGLEIDVVQADDREEEQADAHHQAALDIEGRVAIEYLGIVGYRHHHRRGHGGVP